MSPEETISLEKTAVEPSAGSRPGAESSERLEPGNRVDAPNPRIVSLDVFRGMTIAGMILVNNSGGPSYGPLDHAEWNGWTHTDLIFPFFMFIAGASMALSMSRRSRDSHQPSAVSHQQHRKRLFLHVLRRGATIFFIGLFLNLYPWFFDANRYANLRIPGVLQRIGFCYVFAGIIYLWTSSQPSAVSHQQDQKQKQIPLSAFGFVRNDNGERLMRAGIIVTALLGYWAAMKLIPVPGFGAGDLAPTHNLAAYIDNMVFGTKHMWQHRAWDPEGLLSSVPALCTMLMGTFVGEVFVSSRQPSAFSYQQEQNQVPRFARNDNGGSSSRLESGIQSTWQYKVLRLVMWGVAFVVLGEVWGMWFPINKNLWTSSYVVFTAGYAMLLLAACYWIVDVKGIRKWATPFLVFGSNAILVFTLSTWMTKILLITRVPNGKGGSMSAWSWVILNSWRPHFADVRNSSLAFALSYVLIWLAVMWWFWRKRVFVKI